MVRLLLADDDRTVREGMKRVLAQEGYDVIVARDGEEALRKFAEKRPDLVLLDIEMPRKGGFMTCDEIRQADAAVPIVFLTANDSEANEVRALGVGADGFLAKSDPLTLQLAHIRRAIERTSAVQGEKTRTIITLGRVQVDLTRRVVTEGSRSTELTASEAELFACLHRRLGETVTTEELLGVLRGSNYHGDSGIVRVHMQHLRHKLGAAGASIVTLTNCGYYLVK